MRRCSLILTTTLLAAATICTAQQYEVGGPLAGVTLPLMPTQHGEAPGYPGVLPDGYSSDHLAPVLELYPGSTEQFRAYWSKYTPIRSLFDQQSQIKNWTAPNLPGATAKQVEQYAPPLYWVTRFKPAHDTGETWAPVSVVRAGVNAPVFQLDLGTPGRGLFAVRVIAAVPTDKLRPFREPLYLTLRINDGIKGQTNTYRQRIGYVDDFYSVAEFYFHALPDRRYQAELFVDQGSRVDLLIRNISFDDVLVGSTWKPIKRRRTLHTPEDIEHIKTELNDGVRLALTQRAPMTKKQRLQRDALIWQWLPPLNAQDLFIHMPWPSGVTFGSDTLNGEQLVEQYGKWQAVGQREGMNMGVLGLVDDPQLASGFIINKKLGLTYTIDDLHAHRPLPDPYPFKDHGGGLYFPDPNDLAKGKIIAPIATEVHRRRRNAPVMSNLAKVWVATGDQQVGRDAALDLIRYAYVLPTLDSASSINAVAVHRGFYSRAIRNRQRETTGRWRGHYANYLKALYTYDLLYPYIKNNASLAKAVHRFVPWVRTPDDVLMLLDVYLVQHTAKRIMRYHDLTHNMGIATTATVLGDASFTEPWMQWLFNRTFVYPLQPAGIGNLMISGSDREGPEYIGSTYYAQIEGASYTAASLEPYLRAGGNPKYDLGDGTRYPKALAQAYWQLNTIIAGRDFSRIGDVTGPDKRPGFTINDELAQQSRRGWRWSNDPKFAWMLVHQFGRSGETNSQWKAIKSAAKQVTRAPWLDLPSRVVSNWFGVLETGHEHDDYRFRRAAYVRAGIGWGHQHHDALDLQVVAHGLPMTIDGGQRSGYSKPNDRLTRIHNTLEVDGASSYGYAWVRSLTDHRGARYLLAQSVIKTVGDHHVRSSPVDLYQRQIALIDVDQGRGSSSLTPKQQRPGAKLPKKVTTPNSYIFDVFRVTGGKVHTYCFHGTINDAFNWNAQNVQPVEHVKVTGNIDTEPNYLSMFEARGDEKFAGDAPNLFQATWRMAAEVDGVGGGEKEYLGSNFIENAPRKFTRLHLFDTKDARALRAQANCHKWDYNFTALMVQHRSDTPRSNAYAAIIEPYVGEPFIKSRRALTVADNQGDALRAVAVEVKTTNGHHDVCFADGRPNQTRQLKDVNMTVAGQFAFHSTDAKGLRTATLTGGTTLHSPHVRIDVNHRQRTANVTRVDYQNKTLWIDQPWPATQSAQIFEIGTDGHLTSYTAAKYVPQTDSTRIEVTRGADYYRSVITSIVPQAGRVNCQLNIPAGKLPGYDRNIVASNDDMTKFWRAEHLGGNDFQLTGNSVSENDFEPQGVLRLWEYGVGDQVRQVTSVWVRRLRANIYAVRADVELQLSFRGRTMQWSADQKNWSNTNATTTDGWVRITIPAGKAIDVPWYVRVKP